MANWQNVPASAGVVDAVTKAVAAAFREATGHDMPTGFSNWSFRKDKYTKEWQYGIEMDAAGKALEKAARPNPAAEEYQYQTNANGVKYRWKEGMENWEPVPVAKAPPLPGTRMVSSPPPLPGASVSRAAVVNAARRKTRAG